MVYCFVGRLVLKLRFFGAWGRVQPILKVKVQSGWEGGGLPSPGQGCDQPWASRNCERNGPVCGRSEKCREGDGDV